MNQLLYQKKEQGFYDSTIKTATLVIALMVNGLQCNTLKCKC